MKTILKNFIGKTIRIYTISAVESYLGVLEEVKNEYVVLKSFFKDEREYIAIQYIESFKEEKQG
jgi:ferredoxin-fold anticodon binding domain-containing protein